MQLHCHTAIVQAGTQEKGKVTKRLMELVFSTFLVQPEGFVEEFKTQNF